MPGCSVFQSCPGGEGNEGALVIGREVIAELKLGLHLADHGEALPGDANGLAHRVAAAEEFDLGLCAQERHVAGGNFVVRGNPAA